MPRARKCSESAAVWSDSPWTTRRSKDEKKEILRALKNDQMQIDDAQIQTHSEQDLDEIHDCVSALTLTQSKKGTYELVLLLSLRSQCWSGLR